MRRRALVALAALAACGPAELPETEESGLAVTTADTQYVVDDSSGARLMIVINRPPGAVREIVPREGAADPDAPEAYRVLAPRVTRSMLQAARPPWRVIDVRSPAEYLQQGHIEGAILVQLERLEENVGDLHVRSDQMILAYGKDTATGERAGRLLVKYGFPNVRVLEGGFPAWKAAGQPVQATP
ncbi:MAG: rhodanese-like domain-containing protein [Gemmatimonadota bacterium]